MDDLTHYNNVITLLLRAQQPKAGATPERLEANLRWLIGLARRPARLPEPLRQQLRVLAEGHAAGPPLSGPGGHAGNSFSFLPEAERWLLLLLLGADLRELQGEPVLRREATRLMRRLLTLLPELLREALLLQVVQGFSIPEIAHVMDCSEPEVARLLREARASIFQWVHDGRPHAMLQ